MDVGFNDWELYENISVLCRVSGFNAGRIGSAFYFVLLLGIETAGRTLYWGTVHCKGQENMYMQAPLILKTEIGVKKHILLLSRF